jgi:hypothetical protein
LGGTTAAIYFLQEYIRLNRKIRHPFATLAHKGNHLISSFLDVAMKFEGFFDPQHMQGHFSWPRGKQEPLTGKTYCFLYLFFIIY